MEPTNFIRPDMVNSSSISTKKDACIQSCVRFWRKQFANKPRQVAPKSASIVSKSCCSASLREWLWRKERGRFRQRHPDHFGTQKRIILERGSFWNTEEKKTLRGCSLPPVSRIILEHTSFGSASKTSFASLQNERFIPDFLQK